MAHSGGPCLSTRKDVCLERGESRLAWVYRITSGRRQRDQDKLPASRDEVARSGASVGSKRSCTRFRPWSIDIRSREIVLLRGEHLNSETELGRFTRRQVNDPGFLSQRICARGQRIELASSACLACSRARTPAIGQPLVESGRRADDDQIFSLFKCSMIDRRLLIDSLTRPEPLRQ